MWVVFKVFHLLDLEMRASLDWLNWLSSMLPVILQLLLELHLVKVIYWLVAPDWLVSLLDISPSWMRAYLVCVDSSILIVSLVFLLIEDFYWVFKHEQSLVLRNVNDLSQMLLNQMTHSLINAIEVHQIHEETQLCHQIVHPLNNLLRIFLAHFLNHDNFVLALW